MQRRNELPFRHDGNLQFWRVTDSNMLISRRDLKDVGGGDGGETPRELMCTIIRNEARMSDPNQRHHAKWGHELL